MSSLRYNTHMSRFLVPDDHGKETTALNKLASASRANVMLVRRRDDGQPVKIMAVEHSSYNAIQLRRLALVEFTLQPVCVPGCSCANGERNVACVTFERNAELVESTGVDSLVLSDYWTGEGYAIDALHGIAVEALATESMKDVPLYEGWKTVLEAADEQFTTKRRHTDWGTAQEGPLGAAVQHIGQASGRYVKDLYLIERARTACIRRLLQKLRAVCVCVDALGYTLPVRYTACMYVVSYREGCVCVMPVPVPVCLCA